MAVLNKKNIKAPVPKGMTYTEFIHKEVNEKIRPLKEELKALEVKEKELILYIKEHGENQENLKIFYNILDKQKEIKAIINKIQREEGPHLSLDILAAAIDTADKENDIIDQIENLKQYYSEVQEVTKELVNSYRGMGLFSMNILEFISEHVDTLNMYELTKKDRDKYIKEFDKVYSELQMKKNEKEELERFR